MKNSDFLIPYSEIQKISNKSPKQFKSFIKKQSIKIVSIIQELTEEIEEAKFNIKRPPEIKTGFGKRLANAVRGKRTPSEAEKLLAYTTGSLMEVLNLIERQHKIMQEIIFFICCHQEIARNMIDSLTNILANGFKKSNGEICQLNTDQEKLINTIIYQAESRLADKMEINQKIETQEEMIKQLQESSQEEKRELNDKLESLAIKIQDKEEIIKQLQESSKKILPNYILIIIIITLAIIMTLGYFLPFKI